MLYFSCIIMDRGSWTRLYSNNLRNVLIKYILEVDIHCQWWFITSPFVMKDKLHVWPRRYIALLSNRIFLDIKLYEVPFFCAIGPRSWFVQIIKRMGHFEVSTGKYRIEINEKIMIIVSRYKLLLKWNTGKLNAKENVVNKSANGSICWVRRPVYPIIEKQAY